MGPDGPLRVVDNIGAAWDGAQLTINLKNLFFATFLLSNLPLGCEPWRMQHGFLAVSCLTLVSGQQYDCGDHCEQESNVQRAMEALVRQCYAPRDGVMNPASAKG